MIFPATPSCNGKARNPESSGDRRCLPEVGDGALAQSVTDSIKRSGGIDKTSAQTSSVLLKYVRETIRPLATFTAIKRSARYAPGVRHITCSSAFTIRKRDQEAWRCEVGRHARVIVEKAVRARPVPLPPHESLPSRPTPSSRKTQSSASITFSEGSAIMNIL